jgi:starvation-inducible outer membrane lipoprotein
MLKKLTLIFITIFILGLSACDSKPKTSTEKMKESVHNAVESTKEAAHDTASAAKEAAHDAERSTREAAHDIKKDMK